MLLVALVLLLVFLAEGELWYSLMGLWEYLLVFVEDGHLDLPWESLLAAVLAFLA